MSKKNPAVTPIDPKVDPKLINTNTPVEQIPRARNAADADVPAQPVKGTAQTQGMRRTYSSPGSTTNEQVWGEGGSGVEGYNQVVNAMTQNGEVPTAMTDEALLSLYKHLGIDPALMQEYSQRGGYTQNQDTAIAGGGTGEAAEGFYRDGKWYYYDGKPRPAQAGTSGADEALLSDGSYQAIQICKEEYDKAKKAGNTEQMAYWHNVAEMIRARANYAGGPDGSMYITSGSLESGAGGESGASGNNTGGTSGGSSSTGSKNYPDTPEGRMQAIIDSWKQNAIDQANGQIDYATLQAITELERALEDAQPQFKETAESISADERQALDNAALYAELRGDKGGIGQEQYSSIQNTAAQNRLAVQQAQTKLSTDTARQIADLRAQGEFEKADKMLEITQQYLSQLLTIEQWAAEFGLTQKQFQASLEQWQKEYELATEQFAYDKTVTDKQLKLQEDKYNYDVAQAAKSEAYQMGWMWIEAGQPDQITDAQLKALGMTREQALIMSEIVQASNASSVDDPDKYYKMLYSEGFDANSDPEDMFDYLVGQDVEEKRARSIVNDYIGRKFGQYDAQRFDDFVGQFMSDNGLSYGPGVSATPSANGSTSEWVSMQQDIGAALAAEDYDAFSKIVDTNSSRFSKEQWLWIFKVFEEHFA